MFCIICYSVFEMFKRKRERGKHLVQCCTLKLEYFKCSEWNQNLLWIEMKKIMCMIMKILFVLTKIMCIITKIMCIIMKIMCIIMKIMCITTNIMWVIMKMTTGRDDTDPSAVLKMILSARTRRAYLAVQLNWMVQHYFYTLKHIIHR